MVDLWIIFCGAIRLYIIRHNIPDLIQIAEFFIAIEELYLGQTRF